MSNKTSVRSYSDKQLLNRVKSLSTFTKIPDGLWILGIRSNEDTPNVFDDKFYLYEGEQFLSVITGTTNSGGKVLKGGYLKYNKSGAFVLKSNMWYHDVWTYVYRKSRGYELRQVNAVIGYRDGNKNDKSEEIGEPVKGLFGINFHTTTFKWYNDAVTWFIGGHSAGCQVTNKRDRFKSWMMQFKSRKELGIQKYVTYCMIEEFEPEK